MGNLGLVCTEKENLYKVGGSIKRLKLYCSEVMSRQLKLYLLCCEVKKRTTFVLILTNIANGSVNYEYYQSEQICSIGSGAVKSAIKVLGTRIKISGAQWNTENVNQILSVRCAYLNGLLAI